MVVACHYDNKSEKGYVIREDPVVVVNAFQTLSGLSDDEKANTIQNFEERLDGKILGRLLLSEITKSGLDMTKCIGQGYDKAASSSAKQTKLLKKHLISDNRGAETLICLCTARFVKRHEATSRFGDSLSFIIFTLEEMEDWLD